MAGGAISDECDERGFLFYTTHVKDPLPAAVGHKVVEIVERDRLPARAREFGARLKQGLKDLQQRYPCIGDIRGRGLLLDLEFAPDGGGSGQSAQALSDAVTETALTLGLSANIVRAGHSAGVMRIAPPLTVSEAEIDLGLELLEAALKQALAGSAKLAAAQ